MMKTIESTASGSASGYLKAGNSSISDQDSATFSSADGLSLSRNRHMSIRTGSSADDDLLTIRSSSHHFKDNSRVQELTINKLRFDDVKFVGRDAESEILHSRLDRMMMTASDQPEVDEALGSQGMTIRNKEIVLIKGYSGCGKSALASKLRDWTSKMENGLVVQGKLELTSKTPYSGVTQAFAAICNKLKQDNMGSNSESKRVSGEKIGDQLVSELGSELHQAVSLIPELRSVLPDDYELQISERFEDSNENFEATQEQWKNVFRVLVRAFGTCFSPLVVILDDLQWSDMASLSVIEFLVTDTQNTNPLMVVGCYRSNEVDDTHVLTRMISSLAEKTEKGTLKLTEIELGNVSLEDANKVVMALFGIDDEDITKELSKVCFNRTLGNPFFLIQFVTMLEAEGLVSFNLGLLKWVWDVKNVEQSTMSTKNVVDLLVARMKKLPDDIQLILQYAANLGASFNEHLVQQIWSLHSSNSNSNRQDLKLRKVYDILQKGHYIEKSREGGYNWVHDKVQEAALALGEASDQDFQFEIGKILYYELDENDLEQSLFDVVNLINKGRVQRHVLFSQLNLRAARKAKRLSAFDIGAQYCSHGVALLDDEKWSSMHRELTLSLVVLGSEMELAAGNVEGTERYAQEVVARDDCTTLEKLPAYLAMAFKFSRDLEYKKALGQYLSVLRDLGCSFPRSKALMTVLGLKDLMKIARTSRKKKKLDYKSLPLMTDETQKAIMAILNIVTAIGFLVEDVSVMLFGVTRSYDITMQYGICEESGSSVSNLAVIVLAVLTDYEAATCFTQSAIKLQERAPSRYHESVVLYNLSYSVAWTEPLPRATNIAFEGYSLGIKSGNILWAVFSLLNHCGYFPLQQGKPLRSALAEASRGLAIIEDFNLKDPASICRVICQAMSNLAGESEQTVLLQGKWIDITDGWDPATILIAADTACQRLVLLVFFGKYEEAADLALETGEKYAKVFPGFSFCQFEAFMRGVALFAMLRRTRKRKYRRAAERILHMMDGWVKKGNPNVKQYFCLLKAEQAASRQKHMEAESLYNEAIVISGRSGQLQTAGLANERFADYLLVDRKDKEESRYRLEQAIRFYSEWGAHAVVERLRTDLEKSR